MSNNGEDKKGSGGTASKGGSVPKPLTNIAVGIAQPFTIRQESTTEDNERYRDDTKHRDVTLTAAQRLNWITLIGVTLTLCGILFVYLTFRQSAHALRVDQRAWLGVKHVDYATIQGAFGVMMQLENTGKTPALNVRTHQRIDEVPVDFPLSTDYSGDYSLTDFKGPEIFGPIAPGATPNIGYGETNTTGIIPINASARVNAYFHGRIVYNDVFGHAHWVVFCFFGQRRPVPDPTVGWQPCGKNNEIDNDME